MTEKRKRAAQEHRCETGKKPGNRRIITVFGLQTLPEEFIQRW